jgi:hypothetical protein
MKVMATKAQIAKFPVGALVTCITPEKAYYSLYGSLPECIFTPGMVGVVNSVNVPAAYYSRDGKCRDFCCVDFFVDGNPMDARRPEYSWRVSLCYENIRIYDGNVTMSEDPLKGMVPVNERQQTASDE